MVQQKKLRTKCLERLYIKDGALYWRGTEKPAGYHGEDGYIQVNIDKTLYLAHRLIFLMTYNTLPDLIDHIDRDTRNNNPSNLREASKKLNAINSGLPKNNKSGVKGVSWHKAGQKWTAQIKNDGVKIHLGSYSLLVDAVEARIQAERELWDDVI